jgi:hypothetical protein
MAKKASHQRQGMREDATKALKSPVVEFKAPRVTTTEVPPASFIGAQLYLCFGLIFFLVISIGALYSIRGESAIETPGTLASVIDVPKATHEVSESMPLSMQIWHICHT